MRFLRNSAATVRLVKSIAFRMVRLRATNSMYQFVLLRFLTCQVACSALPDHTAIIAIRARYLLIVLSAGGGPRTHTPLAGPRILSRPIMFRDRDEATRNDAFRRVFSNSASGADR